MVNAAGTPAFILNYKGLDGRRHRDRLDATDQQEAERIMAQRISKQAQAEGKGAISVEAVRPITLSEFMEKNYLPYAKGHLKESSYKKYLFNSKIVLKELGSKIVQHLRPKDIRNYLSKRRISRKRGGIAIPLSGCQLNRERALLSSCLDMAVKDEIIPSNPVAGVKPYAENKRERWLTPAEVESLLKACEGASFEWLRPLIVVATNAGMRVNEILGLTWADTANGTIRVTSIRAKNRKTRFIKITKAVKEVLKAAGRIKAIDSPFIFINPGTGEPYTLRGVDDAFRKVRQIVGFAATGPDGVVFHTLRHTACSWMVQAGIPDRQIMAVLGHGSSRMVSLYAHLAPKHLDGAAAALEAMFESRAQEAPDAVDGVLMAKEVGVAS
jgi:integrase